MGTTRASRHAHVKKTFKSVLRQYGFMPDNGEPRFNGVGPDVCFLLGGILTLVDVVVVNPLADSYVDAEARAAGTTLATAESEKDRRHTPLVEARRMHFFPLALTTFGTVGPRSLVLLRRCARHTTDPSGFMAHMCMALSVAVQTGNAKIIMAATSRWWEYGVR